jgi:hypothetical protein
MLKCNSLFGIVFESEGLFMDDKEIKSKLTSYAEKLNKI